MFCGGPLSGEKSGEHVIPKWLQKQLGLKDRVLMFAHIDPHSKVQSIRRLALNAMLLGRRVCGSCNHGWMSKLEVEVRPILSSLVEGRDIASLQPSESLCLARWTAKTHYALSFWIDFHRLVPLTHPRELKSETSRLPRNVHVFAGRSERSVPIDVIACSTWALRAENQPMPEPEFRKAIGRSYKIGLQLRSLVLVTAHWSVEGDKVIICPGRHTLLGPPSDGVVALSPSHPSESAYLNSMQRLVSCIWVFQGNIRPRNVEVDGPSLPPIFSFVAASEADVPPEDV
jgi:hypothetical protein